MTETNTYKRYKLTAADIFAAEIKKKKRLKVSLWVAGIFLTIAWFAFVIATSASGGARYIYSEPIEITSKEQFEALVGNGYDLFLKEQKVYAHYLLNVKDWNPLCLTYKRELTGWYMCLFLSPVGYISCLAIVAWIKNITTPQEIKRKLKAGVAEGYIPQKDADHIIDEMDYLIGRKERPKNEATTRAREKE